MDRHGPRPLRRRAPAPDGGLGVRPRAPAPDLHGRGRSSSSWAPSPARRSACSSDRSCSWRCRRGPSRTVDRTGGAVAGVLGVLVVVWLLSPVAAEITGWPADQVRNSSITQTVDRVFPSAPDPLRTLRRVIGDDRFPQVFEALRPTPDPGVPPTAPGIDPAVTATRRGVDGEGRGGRVRSAAGRQRSGRRRRAHRDQRPRRRRRRETWSCSAATTGAASMPNVVAFDPNRDLAVLRAPDIDRPALPIADADVGATGAVLRLPGRRRPVDLAVRGRRADRGDAAPTSTTSGRRTATCSSSPPSCGRATRAHPGQPGRRGRRRRLRHRPRPGRRGLRAHPRRGRDGAERRPLR